MRGWQSYFDRKALGELSHGATASAAVGSLAVGWSFWIHQVWLLPVTLALSCGAWILYWSLKKALERGLAADRWTDDARTAVRQTTGRIGLWLMPLWLVILVAQFLKIWGYHHGHPTPMVWMPIWLFSQATTALTRMISPTAPPSERTSLFADMKPVHSDHWGERMTQG